MGFPVEIAESGFPVKIEGFTNITPEPLKDDSVLLGTRNSGNIGVDVSEFYNKDSLKTPFNLFNIQTSKDGFYMGSDGSATLDYNMELGISDYVQVEVGSTYVFGDGTNNNARMLCLFDANKSVVAGGSNGTVTSYTAANGVAFIVVTYYVQHKMRFAIENRSTLSNLPYQTNRAISDTVKILPKNIASYNSSKNLFNYRTVNKGFFLSNIAGTPTPNSTYSYSDFIEVEPNTTYIGSDTKSSTNIRFISYYDANHAKIVFGNDNALTTFTTPSNCKYIIISIETSIINSFQLERGNLQTYYSRHGYKATRIDGAKFEGYNLNWHGRKWISQGDSITAMNRWQPMVYDELGLIHTTIAISGTRVSGNTTNDMNNDVRINQIPVDAELITLMGGTNDWAQSIALGTINSVDVLTFMGALNVTFEKMMTRAPKARILAMSIPYGIASGLDENSLGLTTLDYGKCMIDVARKWGIKCVDIQGQMGINKLNYTSFYTDGLHPTNVGCRRIGDIVLEALYFYNQY